MLSPLYIYIPHYLEIKFFSIIDGDAVYYLTIDIINFIKTINQERKRLKGHTVLSEPRHPFSRKKDLKGIIFGGVRMLVIITSVLRPLKRVMGRAD